MKISDVVKKYDVQQMEHKLQSIVHDVADGSVNHSMVYVLEEGEVWDNELTPIDMMAEAVLYEAQYYEYCQTVKGNDKMAFYHFEEQDVAIINVGILCFADDAYLDIVRRYLPEDTIIICFVFESFLKYFQVDNLISKINDVIDNPVEKIIQMGFLDAVLYHALINYYSELQNVTLFPNGYKIVDNDGEVLDHDFWVNDPGVISIEITGIDYSSPEAMDLKSYN